MSNVEKQFILQEHDAMFGSFNHFKEISIIFGYAVMFSVAFPLPPRSPGWPSTSRFAWTRGCSSRRVADRHPLGE